MTTSARFGFALEYVSDIAAARRFFVDVLGLQIDRDHPTFVQFRDSSGNYYAVATDDRMDPDAREPELWWLVDDARAALQDASNKAEVSMQLREMPFGTCFGVKDPNGQVHYVLQLSQQRPSQQV